MQVSEVMHSCTYGFKPVHGNIYYVYLDIKKDIKWMSLNHPGCWSAGPGENNTFLMAVKLMGDSTWQEITLDGY